MRNLSVNVSILALLFSMGVSAYAGQCGLMTDPTVTSACQSVWSACQSANVKDPATGKSGYQFGEKAQGDGLWANCVGPLAKGQTPQGLSSVPTQQAAKACEQAAHTYR